MKFFRHILTSDAESKVYDIVRSGVFVSLVTGISLVVYSVVYRGDKFDFTAFGLGVAAILAAGGGAMWARKDVEVSPRKESKGTAETD